MEKIIITALLVSICAASCNTNGSTSIFEGEKTAEELRLELKAKEESNPGQYNVSILRKGIRHLCHIN
jgi:hypothetical protein